MELIPPRGRREKNVRNHFRAHFPKLGTSAGPRGTFSSRSNCYFSRSYPFLDAPGPLFAPLSFLFISMALPAALKYTLITASYL